MRTPIRITILLLLAVGGLALLSCESSDVIAPSGSQMTVSANPGTVVIDQSLAGRTLEALSIRSSTRIMSPVGTAISYGSRPATWPSSTSCSLGSRTISGPRRPTRR